jgi:phosphoribosyl 1,2-cyclic phosphodiesterase
MPAAPVSEPMHPDAPTAAVAADTDSPAPAAAPSPDRLLATCWGTRGSIPSPGPATVRFGGNTSCLEVRTGDGRLYVFDAGTGLRILGNRLNGEPGPLELDLFLTHFHWDHIQGLPFFAPLHSPDTVLRIHAPPQGDLDVESLLRAQMGPVYFPVPYETLAADLSFVPLEAQAWRDSGVDVAAYRLRHSAHTVGYRIRSGTASLAYLPDNELEGGTYPVDGPGWYPGLVEFLEGVDLLIHDAMFTAEEYDAVRGWGHSSGEQAVRLAEQAGARRLLLFHHAPERADGELDALLARVRADVQRRGSKLDVGVAAEGEELRVPGRSGAS